MKQFIAILSSICCLCIACNKEQVVAPAPCLHVPCNDTTEYYGNKVARNTNFRIGKWVNIRNSAPVKDTLTFHSDSTFSHSFNGIGLIHGKYDFWYLYMRYYTGYDNVDVEEPFRKETMYNDTTGVFSILHIARVGLHGGDDYQLWDHFVKVE